MMPAPLFTRGSLKQPQIRRFPAISLSRYSVANLDRLRLPSIVRD